MNLPYANKMLAFSGFDKKNKRTKHNDSDINMFLSSFVLCCDGISARVSSQAHRNCYNRGSFSRFHLITIKKEKKRKPLLSLYLYICVKHKQGRWGQITGSAIMQCPRSREG